MSSYKHFTLEERKKLEEGLKKGKSQRAIARELGRSASSISREVARNITKGESDPFLNDLPVSEAKGISWNKPKKPPAEARKAEI